MRKIFVAFLMLLATVNLFAQSLPKMKDKYVTDAAGILSKSELKQLRADVKAMCDYYSTRVLAGIVPTFDGYDIEEYAGMLAEHWDLDDENTMFIIVKPRSDDERGEAMLVTSSDLQDVFNSEVCDEIVQDEMIPHFKKDDYFGGIEAALEYMNNMSNEEEEAQEEEAVPVTTSGDKQKTSSKLMEFLSDVGVGTVTLIKWGLILLAIIAVVGAIAWLIIKKKEEKKDREELSAPKLLISPSKSDSEEMSTAIADKKQEIEKRKREIEELNRLEQESRDLDDEYENILERNERNERARRRDYDDYDDYDDRDVHRNQRSTSDLEDILKKMTEEKEGKGKSILGKVGKVAIGVAGAAVVGKMVKKRREKDDDEGGLLSDIGSVFKKKNKTNKASSNKPKLGGSGNSKASGKPKLGGGGGNKPKLGGNSSSGGW